MIIMQATLKYACLQVTTTFRIHAYTSILGSLTIPLEGQLTLSKVIFINSANIRKHKFHIPPLVCGYQVPSFYVSVSQSEFLSHVMPDFTICYCQLHFLFFFSLSAGDWSRKEPVFPCEFSQWPVLPIDKDILFFFQFYCFRLYQVIHGQSGITKN